MNLTRVVASTLVALVLSSTVASAHEAHFAHRIQTNYQQYAQVDETGFAYSIFNDPDVSSEIQPLNAQSSPDVLLFTFDDTPRGENSNALQIAQTLHEKDANAIFLVNGMYLQTEQSRQIVKQIYDLGFEIGNHTSNHPNLRELTYEEQYKEIATTSQIVEEITGEKPRWFRPPFGKFNMDTILICNELGMQLMTWSFGYDWMEEYQDGKALADVSLDNKYLRSGANILMHDLPWTAQAVGTMVDGYRAKGYHIVNPYIIQRQVNSTAPLQH
ncbi:polysaccharide deacetylase family protein [Aerococcaceae bacterium zg-ZJ1578]|uniref:polysaccharide deacetylase family protein n=1 Tax=Aerococcaceae bacterium zg-252 TaxID=2796928 RepID=UPI001A31ED39|nr:polysaccharide deacetylase family protein [Aerococcaceae bacterium zg-1578]